MDKPAIKDLVYGGLTEMMHNLQYYYKSGVNSVYSYWTEEGQKAVAEFMNLVAAKICDAEHEELNARAKEMVLSQLKSVEHTD
jgi:regulator of sigma D